MQNNVHNCRFYAARCRNDAAALRRALSAAAIAALTLFIGVSALATPLDDYVAAPDPAFKYTKLVSEEKSDCTTSVYHLVSQSWLDETKVDRPLWEHTVLVTVPKEVAYTTSMMFIGGGDNPKEPEKPETDNGPLERIAVLTKSIVVEIKQIPNQPLFFVGDTMEKYKASGRVEDALITFGWDKYLISEDPLWLARLPMTKAVVRAMDLIQKEFPQVNGFFVAGGSKRGWTTWTVAAVDKRVIGIGPAVIDVLNFEPSVANQFDAYGFWPPAIGDYVDMKIVDRLHTPELRKLLSVVDPYVYRDRLTMPKYLINAAGDQFFPPDSWKFYFDDLKGEKFLCYIPNVDHGLNADAYFHLASFYKMLLDQAPFPKFSWNRAQDGALTVTCETKPVKVVQWKAHNPEARDFRLETLGAKYESSPATESQPGVYSSNVQAPEKGWTAFFLEMEFPNPGFPAPLNFTTGISILPDTYPGRKAESAAIGQEDTPASGSTAQ